MNEGAGILLVSMLLANANRYDFEEKKYEQHFKHPKVLVNFRLFIAILFGYLWLVCSVIYGIAG